MLSKALQVRDNHLFYTFTGDITFESLLSTFKDIYSDTQTHQISYVLLDLRTVQGALSVIELYDVTNRIFHIIGPETWVAYLPPSHWKTEDDRFSRNVSWNRGGHLEVFADTESAINWFPKP